VYARLLLLRNPELTAGACLLTSIQASAPVPADAAESPTRIVGVPMPSEYELPGTETLSRLLYDALTQSRLTFATSFVIIVLSVPFQAYRTR
jgi:hypothetical protein